MSVKICGHKVRWQKPIKIYTLLVKTLCLLALGNLLLVPAGMANDAATILQHSKASSGDAVPCQPLHTSRMESSTLHKANASARTQRSAGPSTMSPAMMLALALGYRNVPGPVVRTRTHVVADESSQPVAEEEAMLIPGDREGLPSYASIVPSAGGD